MGRGRHKSISDADVIRLRNAGFTGDEIANDLQCCRPTVQRILRQAGMTGGCGRITIERQRLLELWESAMTLSEIGVQLSCAPATVIRLGRRHKLPSRKAFSAEAVEAVSAEEEAASCDSLQLSPWVQSRIRELGLGVIA